MDENSANQLQAIKDREAVESLKGSVIKLAAELLALTGEVRANKKQTEVDLQELAGRIELNKAKLNVEVKAPEIKVDASGLVNWIKNKLFHGK